MPAQLAPAFQHDAYLFRRKFFKVFGAAFHAYDLQGRLLFYSKQKAFRLREDIRIYSDEMQRQELLIIKTPQILDLAATYNIQDPATGEFVGSVRRKFLKSIVCDEWQLLSNKGNQIGTLTELNLAAALISRFVNLVPQRYIITDAAGRRVARIAQHFNPIVLKYTMTIEEPQPIIDRRLLIASGILLAAIERRQD